MPGKTYLHWHDMPFHGMREVPLSTYCGVRGDFTNLKYRAWHFTAKFTAEARIVWA